MNRFGDPEVGCKFRHTWRRPMGGVEKVFGCSPTSSGEQGGNCFWMKGGNSWVCNVRPPSSNAGTLMGFESFSDDVRDNVAAEVGISTPLSHDDSVIVVSARGRRELEGKAESRMSSSEFLKLAEALNTGAKLEDNIDFEEEVPKVVLGGESGNFIGIVNDSICNGNEVAHRVFSRLLKKGSSGNLDGDFTREAGGSCCSLISSKSMDASIASNGYSMEGRYDTLSVAGSEKVNFVGDGDGE